MGSAARCEDGGGDIPGVWEWWKYTLAGGLGEEQEGKRE
jgi:hypothetical protein